MGPSALQRRSPSSSPEWGSTPWHQRREASEVHRTPVMRRCRSPLPPTAREPFVSIPFARRRLAQPALGPDRASSLMRGDDGFAHTISLSPRRRDSFEPVQVCGRPPSHRRSAEPGRMVGAPPSGAPEAAGSDASPPTHQTSRRIAAGSRPPLADERLTLTGAGDVGGPAAKALGRRSSPTRRNFCVRARR
jgi:hypothetical protein